MLSNHPQRVHPKWPCSQSFGGTRSIITMRELSFWQMPCRGRAASVSPDPILTPFPLTNKVLDLHSGQQITQRILYSCTLWQQKQSISNHEFRNSYILPFQACQRMPSAPWPRGHRPARPPPPPSLPFPQPLTYLAIPRWECAALGGHRPRCGLLGRALSSQAGCGL